MEVSEFKNVLWEYTRKIGEHTTTAYQPLCEQNGLTMLQVRILVELAQQKSHTIGSLANHINIAGANVSAMCKKLESKGLLERVRDEEDERVVKVTLKDKGLEIVTTIDQQLNDRISSYMESETEETLENIIIGLKKINELLQHISKG